MDIVGLSSSQCLDSSVFTLIAQGREKSDAGDGDAGGEEDVKKPKGDPAPLIKLSLSKNPCFAGLQADELWPPLDARGGKGDRICHWIFNTNHKSLSTDCSQLLLNVVCKSFSMAETLCKHETLCDFEM